MNDIVEIGDVSFLDNVDVDAAVALPQSGVPSSCSNAALRTLCCSSPRLQKKKVGSPKSTSSSSSFSCLHDALAHYFGFDDPAKKKPSMPCCAHREMWPSFGQLFARNRFVTYCQAW
eukprot:scaffold781_cov132-Cylindrotheca_fusiformis.AAC.31